MKRNEWMKKTLAISATLFILTICFSPGFIIHTAQASGINTTIYVPTQYSYLQDAINASSNGYTIQINSSINITRFVTINKSISLIGNQSNYPIINGSTIYGLHITNNNISIQHITIRNCSTAINIYNSSSSISDITIHNVSIMNCSQHAIQLINARQINITNCTIKTITSSGMYLSNTSHLFFNNSLINHTHTALNLTTQSENNTITNNTFRNSSIGIHISSSNNNSIFLNNLIYNIIYATDNGTNNWNNATYGNYWGNYTGTDSNSDGIGDILYQIAGGANQDTYPLGYFVPIVNFTYTPSTPSTSDAIQFTSTSTDPNNAALNYSWDFNDGTTSFQQDPAYNYSNNGTYNVTLTVTNSYGLTNQTNQTIIVLNSPPSLSFNISPTPGLVNQTISFKVNATDHDGSIINWTWSFGDGEKYYAQNTTHTYTQDGSYSIYLNATDDDGTYTNISRTVTVTYKPIVNFTYSPSSSTTNQTITFTDTTTDEDSSISSRLWSFGDDETSTSQNPTHSYTSRGTYTVTLSVTDSHGATNQTTKTLTILNSHPKVNFSYSPESPTDLQSISFTDYSNDTDGTIVNWTWTFGDGSTNYSQNASHQYSNNGTYTVTLNITDNHGGTNETSVSIIVKNVEPTTDFSYEPLYPKIGDTVWFNDSSYDNDGTIVNWTWTFGDGSTNYSQNTSYIFSSFESYSVSLLTRDDDENTSTKTKQIIVRKEYKKQTSNTQSLFYDLSTLCNTAFSVKTTNETNLTISLYSHKPSDLSNTITSYQNLETYTNISLENESLLDWINISFYYTSSDIEDQNINESSLTVFYWNITQNKWISIESIVTPITNNDFAGYVTVNISHLTFFTLGGTVKEEDDTISPTLPSVQSSINNTVYNTSSPTLTITYNAATLIDSALLDGYTVNYSTNDSKTFTFTINQSLANGNYTLHVTIINGSVTRTNQFNFVINQPQKQKTISQPLTIPSWVLNGIIGFVALVLIYYLIRKTQFITFIIHSVTPTNKPKSQTTEPVNHSLQQSKQVNPSFSNQIQQFSSSVNNLLFGTQDPWLKRYMQMNELLTNIDLFVEKPDVYVGIQEKLILEDEYCKKIINILKKNNSTAEDILKKTKMSSENLSQSLSVLLKYGLITMHSNETFQLTYPATQLDIIKKNKKKGK